jgi:hypothetical protein
MSRSFQELVDHFEVVTFCLPLSRVCDLLFQSRWMTDGKQDRLSYMFDLSHGKHDGWELGVQDLETWNVSESHGHTGQLYYENPTFEN